MTHTIEHRLHTQGFQLIAGVDEAGRGAWAGPLVSAAVILPPNFRPKKLKDSKQLTALERLKFYQLIIVRAIAWAVDITSVKEIDRLGVHIANRHSLYRAINQLHHRPDFILADAFNPGFADIPTLALPHADSRWTSVAAASIIAKVTRDQLMTELTGAYTVYNFNRHKGYGTADHQEQLRRYGPSDIHRTSFQPIKGFSKTAN